jgi:hypothetical protein
MADPTIANLAIVAIFALVFGAAYWVALYVPRRRTDSHQEARKVQAVRVSRLPREDAPLYGLPSVRRREDTTSR